MPRFHTASGKKRSNPNDLRSARADMPMYDDFVYDDLQDLGNVSRSHSFREQEPAPTAAKPFQDERSVQTADDFVYQMEDVPESNSETPEEAMREFRAEESSYDTEEQAESLTDKLRKKRGWNPDSAKTGKKEKPRLLRNVFLVLITVIIVGIIGSMALVTFVGYDALRLPEEVVAAGITPVQSAFSSATEAIAGYFRTLKLRANLEQAYSDLVAENEQLTYQAMLADELQIQLSQYENMYDEIEANQDLRPLICQVIGKGDNSNYFTTFTINKGTRDGVENYMAVTYSGALVGYTENVTETKSDVRAIIDSDASIAALIQSSRDQGIVSGTLGVDGTASCRMYYLSDSLPRPGDIVVTSGVGMSFPKGIPIGTVRESTRGMESNKSYIVVEPKVDFEHLEYVIVLRYKPQAEAVTGRESTTIEFVALETPRPYPTLRIFANSFYTATPEPEILETPAPSEIPEETLVPTATPAPTSTPTPAVTIPAFEYHIVQHGPTPEPTPTPTPSPTPYITLTPLDMTYEEDS